MPQKVQNPERPYAEEKDIWKNIPEGSRTEKNYVPDYSGL